MNLEALRTLLASPPSEAIWRALVAEVEQARGDTSRWARFEAEALPLMHAALATWPREPPRVAPLAWLQRLCSASEAFAADAALEPVLPDLDAFAGIYFPGDADELVARPAGHAPELALANTLELGGEIAGNHGFEPLDALGHAYLRDCPHITGVRAVRYAFEWHEYADSPLIAPEALWEVLGGPGWRGLEALSLGWLNDETLPIRLPQSVSLRALTLIGNAYTDAGPEPLEQLPALATSPCLATVEVLALADFVWSEALFGLLLGELRWPALRELRLLGVADHRLADEDDSLADLIRRITAHPLAGPITLVLVAPEGFAADELSALANAAYAEWRVRVE